MSDWKALYWEDKGAVPGKFWVTNGFEKALFKPDSELHESVVETEVYRIAHKLGIACAKAEQVEIFGQKGVLSCNFKTDNATVYCPADNLYLKSGEMTFRSKNTEQNTLPRKSKLFMDYIHDFLPGVEPGAVDMLFWTAW